MIFKTIHAQTLEEERVNATTHFLGVILGIIALVLLSIHSELHGDTELVISVMVYSCSLILLFSASTLYHAVRDPRKKEALHFLDHSAIYILIAGTYTPFALITIGGTVGWFLFSIIWLLAILGILYKWFYMGHAPWFSICLYLAMGWLALIALKPILHDLPLHALYWLFAGGAFYTFGVVFFIFDHKIKYFHALWHLCVLSGSLCHFFAILFYVKIVLYY